MQGLLFPDYVWGIHTFVYKLTEIVTYEGGRQQGKGTGVEVRLP